MSNITLDIAGRKFTVACGPGEEPHIERLGRIIGSKIEGMPGLGFCVAPPLVRQWMVITKQGVEMVALCGRKPTTVDTPKKREIRDKMYAQKYEAKSKAYLNDIRKAAMIEYR